MNVQLTRSTQDLVVLLVINLTNTSIPIPGLARIGVVLVRTTHRFMVACNALMVSIGLEKHVFVHRIKNGTGQVALSSVQ